MRSLLRGVGQIFLQPSVLSGIAFLAALTVTSWKLAIFALAGTALGTLTGLLLRATRKDLDDGLYGFNAALVGIAGGALMPSQPVAVAIACIVSTLLFHVAVIRKWNVFTAPFVLVTLVLLQVFPPAGSPLSTAHYDLEIVSMHFGQVMFLDHPWSGLLCVLGVFLGNRTSGLAALIASALIVALGLVTPVDRIAFEGGLYGFNAVLTAIALHQQRPRWLHTVAGALLATVITALAMYVGVRALTAPFIVVAWLGSRRRS
ncbi:MAG: urea transporter [Archangium sp.]